ncbi:MAG: glycosyltransferase [Anaerolineae bacterium]|nr:glycosyltransferase [Anaerolineae bacterium]
MTRFTDGLRVTLIATFRSEESSLPSLLRSLESQTRLPDEVVFVDGGSEDDTVPLLRRWAARQPFLVRVLEAPGANIAQGRNLAISAATHDLIAVTDAGVELEPSWLACLVAPFAREHPPDVAAGTFRGRADTVFQAAMSATVLPLPEELDERRFLPSSRSVAFTREAWRTVGGYPEWATYCEDLLFDMALLAAGKRMALAHDALVHFAPRGTLRSYWRQYRNYAMGDGQTGILWKRHLIRYATYLGLVPALAWLSLRHPLWLLGYVAGALLYLRRPLWRLPRLTPGWPWHRRGRAALWIPVLRLWGDLAKMVGYPLGWRHGWAHRSVSARYRRGAMSTPTPHTVKE